MKQPDVPTIGGERKTLPTGKARKILKGSACDAPRKRAQPGNALEPESEQELIRVFGQK